MHKQKIVIFLLTALMGVEVAAMQRRSVQKGDPKVFQSESGTMYNVVLSGHRGIFCATQQMPAEWIANAYAIQVQRPIVRHLLNEIGDIPHAQKHWNEKGFSKGLWKELPGVHGDCKPRYYWRPTNIAYGVLVALGVCYTYREELNRLYQKLAGTHKKQDEKETAESV